MTKLTYDIVADALASGAVGFRAVTKLRPLGGPGDKVFPPTFRDSIDIELKDGKKVRTKYAVEYRRIDGQPCLCVLLDSVASQANRMEEALQEAWERGELEFPIVRVDFTGETHEDPRLDLSTIGGTGYLTSLQVPHRLADALLRDSLLDGVRFRASTVGRAFTEASPSFATPIYKYSPSALVFGMWDSTGPKGGQGAKFQRALISEIVGVGVEFGRKTSSRIDPAGTERNAGPLYAAVDPDEEWTIDESQARREKGQPVLFSRRGGDKPGRPSNANHGNITPTIESEAGGVTLDYAQQITVLSLPALRRLRFPKDLAGESVAPERRAEVELRARAALAALGLAAVSLQRAQGYDLRSRCVLVPEDRLAFELVERDGTVKGSYGLEPEDAVELVKKSLEAAQPVGMRWSREVIDLKPAPKLVALLRKSREVAAQGEAEPGDA